LNGITSTATTYLIMRLENQYESQIYLR
jgi:hypothetical protein